MRYWVYINDKVDGPYDETKLVTLNGFSQNTLICSEEVASSGGQEWVKASSIFEFDEVPVQESNPDVPPTTANNVPNQTANALNESLLLSKLDSLTEELSHLHHRLDTLQTDLDKALEQNEKLSQQIAVQTSALATPVSPAKEEPAKAEEEAPAPVETKLPEEVVLPSDEENKDKEEGNFPEQAAPKEEELIIRSALDSIYGDKPLAQPIVEETFQDLLPEKEEEKLEKIEEELTFTPVEEKQEEPTVKEEPVVKEALITTPSAEEISRDELINELTASPKEDILDQIIQEHQEQKATPSSSDSTEKSSSLSGAAVAGIAALGGLAAGAALTGSKEKSQEIPVENSAANSFSMATDKNNPAVLEEVLPPDQMPPDVSKPEEQPLEKHIDLDPLPTTAEEPVQTVEEKAPDFSDIHEDTVQELVPGAVLKKEQKTEEPDGIYEKPIEEISEEPQAHSTGELTEKDLEDAFGPQEEPMSPTLTEVADNQSPNDLTEIELKEGSTYLISDFVPPAQVGDDSAAMEALGATFNQSLNKQQETIIQDMLAVSNKAEKTQMLPTDGLPEDIEATKISLENTIQAKRGASLDIKTAPMVPEPANTPRLDVSELDDVNAQHEIKTSKSGSGLTKIVLGALIGLLLFIVLYVALGVLNLLPKSVNLFSKKEVATAPVANELLQDSSQALPEDEEEEYSVEAEEMGQVLSDVQNISLSNGFTLKEFVESKHAAISKDLISWEVADAVEPDNYSITVKIPPENPQNFKTVYRFNYNMENGLLEPTISDAKNLLDQAEGQA